MGARSLLVSDVDGTLLGDDAALQRLARWHAARSDRLRLVYSSGRLFESVAESVRTTALPEPWAIIGGVGTDVRRFADGAPLDAWQRRFRDFDAGAIRALLAGHHRLTLQPAALQSAHKVSYFAYDLDAADVDGLHQQLQRAGFDARVVYSSNRDLDVLPTAAGKGNAAAFVAARCDTPPEETIVSGDSGNDLAMFEQGFRGVVVANAHAELKRLDGPNVYHSAHPYAAGVLDGLWHWLGEEPQ